jgi:hypothetical protein
LGALLSLQLMSRLVAPCLVSWLATGCHVVTELETTRPGATHHLQHPEGAIARRPTIVLTDSGALRFVEPLECPSEDVVDEDTSVELTTGPNLATFVVGVVATAIGGVLTVRGVFDSSAGPYLYGGIAGVAAGLPLAIGPWLGNQTEIRASPKLTPLRRIGPTEPCGLRPFAARSATVRVHGIEVRGAIDREGTFGVSPYQLVDAYDTKTIAGWDVTAIVDTEGGPRTVSAVIEGQALAKLAPTFLAHGDVDSRIEPMRLVPGLVVGLLRVSFTSTSDGPALHIVLPLRNDGPGEAWAVRGRITSPVAAIDGRIIYVGHLAKHDAVARELIIPLTPEGQSAIRSADLDVSVELRDAHGTAPSTPVRFRGPVLVDAPR